MAEHGPTSGGQSSVPASWFTIAAIVLAELVVAAVIAFSVAQLYVGYECGDRAYREEHAEQCRGGFPYPLF
jgi:hypothetical protein